MLANQFHAAANGARTLAQLEDVSRLVWRAHAEQHLSDSAATALSVAVEARRARIKGMRPAPLPRPPSARRRAPRSPDREASIERRRRQAASGAMPPAIAGQFTTGEAAALTVVAREIQRAGRCELYLDKIAALAGVCKSTAQNALREAKRLGLVTVTERRRRGAKSLTNVVEVVSPEWRAWLRLKIGSKFFDPTVKDSKITCESARRLTERTCGAASPHAVLLGSMSGTGSGGGNKGHSMKGSG